MIERKIVGEFFQDSEGEVEHYYLIREVHQNMLGDYIINYKVAKVLCRHSMVDNEFRVREEQR